MVNSELKSAVSQPAVSRRAFVGAAALAGAAAAGVSANSNVFGFNSWLAPASAAADDTKIACTYHQSHCGGMCSLKCSVRDGRLVMVEPNDCGDDRYETICLKGISEVQHIYGEGRVQTPLKRTGERGSGEFKAVSWDEALDDIVKQTQDIQDKHGKDALMVCTTSEADFPFLAAMFGARGGGLDGIDVGIGNGLDPSTGLGAGYAMSAPEARDWTRSKLVLTVGSNYCESSLPTARLFFEAMDAGAKTVTVDPHFSTTASKSNEWIPIEPGTDAALFLGMSSHIIDNELYDEEFMKLHSSYPFLVDKKTGKLLRDHEPVKVLDEDGEEVDETGDQNSFMVVDSASGAVVAHNSTEDPSLHASVEVNGSEACTVFDLLCENQKQYDLSWASKITGIEEDKIATLAEEYAEGPSALCLGWGGNDKMSNADVAGHAAAVLTAITGNIGKPGAGVGVYVGASYNCHSATLGSWSLPDDMTTASADVDFYDLPDKENNVHAAIFAGDFIAQHLANMSKTQEWAKTLDLIVTIDPYFTEGGKWADYILPSTTRFEYDEDYGNVKSGYSQIVIQEKVLDPLFEAKTDLTIQREFARRLGVEDALPKSAKERVDAILSTSSDEDVAALTIEQIAANSGVWPVAGRDEIRPALTDYEFATTSGRMEVYYDDLVDYDQQLPKWEPCVEIGDDAVRAKHPLQLSNVRTRFRIHNQFNDSVWLKQYYEPTIAINPKDLDEKGIKTGDTVEVSNDRGSFKVRVHANESIRPGSARLYEAATADYTKGGNMQSVTNDKMIKRGAALMCGPVIPFSDTLVDVKKA